MGGCVSLGLFSTSKKKKKKDNKGYLCQVWRNKKWVLRLFVMKRDDGAYVD